MARPTTALDTLRPDLRAQLEWPAMVAAGVPEAPLAIMRLDMFQRMSADWEQDDDTARLLDTLRNGAKAARRRLNRNPALVAYYARRSELRDVYLSMGWPLHQLQAELDKLPRVTRAAKAKPVEAASIVLTPEQELAREQEAMRVLAAGPAPRLEKFCADRGEPVYAPRERLPAAINQRRDWALAQRNYREAVAFVKEEELARSRQAAALEAAGMAVSGEDSAPKVMRGAAFQRLPPAERVLHDLLLLAHQGREIPRASVHAQGGVPLFKRSGLR